MYIIIILALLILGLLYLINRKKPEPFSNSDKFISIPNYKLLNNKRINMFNIKIHNEILDEIPDSVCTSDEACDGGKGRCISYINENRCYKVINKEIYEFSKKNRSYIELTNINSLDIKFSFMIIINSVQEDQMILRSELGVWEIMIVGGDMVINIRKPNGKLIKSDVLVENSYGLSNSLLKCNLSIGKSSLRFEILDSNNIRSQEKVISFFQEGGDKSNNIYSCEQAKIATDCGPSKLGTCENLYRGMYKCSFNDRHKIIFGKPTPMSQFGEDGEEDGGSSGSNEIEYFDGYLGGFEFDKVIEIYSKQCTFQIPADGYDNRKKCIDDCNNPNSENPNNCSKQDCEDKCSQIKVCGFDSKETISRHEIDCMNKCISNSDCPTSYCKEQCFGCGSECWWLKNNAYSNQKQENESGKPGAVKINLTSTSHDGKKASIKWKPPNINDPDGEILGYVGLLYKTFKKADGLTIDKINLHNCNKYCEYVFSNLIPNETYTIGVRAFNSFGIGGISNLITFKTTKKSINTNILNNIEEPANFSKGSFTEIDDNYCNL
tara:strand:- start:1833 stop:3482 length:1650 start_codon:yes stop_codon:yes gene_type:complete